MGEGSVMDKKNMIENLAHKAYEKNAFNGAWLYAENGEIVSKGAIGFRDPENKLPMQDLKFGEGCLSIGEVTCKKL